MQMQKEVHLTGKDLTAMVQLRPQDVGIYAIVPGPKDRLEALIKKLENPVRNFSFMEYTMYTGTYQGIKITAMNGGRFSTDTSITTEVMCHAGIKNIIRIGTCGALDENISIGDLVVVDKVIRGDGVTPYYVESKFQTISDKKISDILFEVAQQVLGLNPRTNCENKKTVQSIGAGVKVHRGTSWTTDALLRETREIVEAKRKEGAIAVDMVSSTLLTLCQVYKVCAASVLAVSDNVITGEMGFMNPLYYMAEANLINVALETVKRLEGG
jgi:uridine phosphorylase